MEEATTPIAVTPGKGKVNGFKWEHLLVAILGGAAVASSGLLFFQWKHAALGRRVSGDVVDFLKRHGSVVSGGRVAGGPVTASMVVDEAVVNTVDTILRDITRRTLLAQASNKPLPPKEEEEEDNAPQPQPQPQPQPRGGSPKGGRVFPEPVISGKTGKPVAHDGEEDGDMSQGNNSEGFSYNPPMPPGMRPPGNMP